MVDEDANISIRKVSKRNGRHDLVGDHAQEKKHTNFLKNSLNAFREFLDGDENRKLV